MVFPNADGGMEVSASPCCRLLCGTQTCRANPTSILVLIEKIAEIIPAGVINVVNGFGREAGQALATSQLFAKLAFTGSTDWVSTFSNVRRKV